MSLLDVRVIEETSLDMFFPSGSVPVDSPAVSDLVKTYQDSQRSVLEGVLNEFSETEIPVQRREDLLSKFASSIETEITEEALEEFLKETDRSPEQLSLEDLKEFLIKRYQATGSRTITSELIDEIRREGLHERLDDKFRTVVEALETEKDGSQENTAKIDALVESFREDLEEQKEKLTTAYLSDEKQAKEIYSEQLRFFERLEQALDAIP